MTDPQPLGAEAGTYALANGVRIFYRDVGQGQPLILLHGGTSTGGGWIGQGSLATFAPHFRLIAPDTRGHGRTRNPAGAPTYAQLADDLAALLETLGLERPLICGFSDGGVIAWHLALRRPDLVRAIVTHGGIDPAASARYQRHIRAQFGGNPTATRPDPDFIERAQPEVAAELRALHDRAQGDGAWKTMLAEAFVRWAEPPSHTDDALAAISAPVLVSLGDRDEYFTPEEAVAFWRRIPGAELAIIPHTGHTFLGAPLAKAVVLDFLLRHRMTSHATTH